LLALAGGFVVLVVLGFVVRVDDVSVWTRFGQVVSGKGPKGGGKVGMEYLSELERLDEYLDHLRSELSEHTKSARSGDAAALKETLKSVQVASETIGFSISNCETTVRKLKEGGYTRPAPSDFEDRARKLATLSRSYKDLAGELEKKAGPPE
jgi:hypothetical protein